MGYGVSDLALSDNCGNWNRAVIASRAQLYATPKRQIPRVVQAAAPPPPVSTPVLQLQQATVPAAATVEAPPLRRARRGERPAFYAAITVALTVAGVIAVWFANQKFAPEMYGDAMVPAAEALSRGENYAVFDLNINIRKLRDEHIKRMTSTPELVVLGASQWQEANHDILPAKDWYNSHIHRDYWEDILGMVEMWDRHGRLPRQMVITIRDNLFLPLDDRRDFLWEPGIPFYRAMADHLGIEKQSYWKTLPWARFKERFSLAMLFENMTRWYNAEEKPHASRQRHFKSLDTLLPDGSILWSADHKAVFTPERMRREALALAEYKIAHPPKVDPRGVADIDRVIGYLKEKGVEVFLAHPPYNPIFFERVQGTAYVPAMQKIEQITRGLAEKHGLVVLGGFDPDKVGCVESQYIDAEHSSPDCIGRILKQLAAAEAAPAMRGMLEAE
jgi:hypothetical protein